MISEDFMFHSFFYIDHIADLVETDKDHLKALNTQIMNKKGIKAIESTNHTGWPHSANNSGASLNTRYWSSRNLLKSKAPKNNKMLGGEVRMTGSPYLAAGETLRERMCSFL